MMARKKDRPSGETHLVPPEALLLAAGLGTRMRPLTETVPKPMLALAGRPLMDHVFIACRAEGVSNFVTNIHYLPEQILAHLVFMAKLMPECRFQISDERAELLGTGGAVVNALPMLNSDPILICNTDSVWQPFEDRPIPRMQRRLAQNEADIVLLCVRPERAIGYDGDPDFFLDRTGRLSLDAGAGRPVIFAGVTLARRSVFTSTPTGPFSIYRLFERAFSAGTLAGTLLEADWFHVGDPIGLQRANELFHRPGAPFGR
ncbi:MAG: nucleotidyltransferase family protein [Alphaproteobacteria bacterium]|nr:nucleotidyltransferase family protein [Alphaproteobacteria bacterium]